MPQKRVKGPAGAVVTFEVPGPGMDQRTYDLKIKSGEFTELPAEEKPAEKAPADEDKPKRKPGRPKKAETVDKAAESDAEGSSE